MPAIFVFLDGVGLGPSGPQNPLDLHWPALHALAGGQRWTDALHALSEPRHVVRAVDATLGVDGLPQSGTGQAALFSGANAAALAGRHYGPFPHSKTREALRAQNLFVRIDALDLSHEEPAAFANAYPDRFFSYARRRDRWTVTTRCCLDAGLRIRTEADVRAGTALTADITGKAWQVDLGLDVPQLTPAQAGQLLANIAAPHACTVFEYFLTDKAGHARDPKRAKGVLQTVDQFFGALLEALDPVTDLLVVCSDHGNLEDLSIKTHTRNPVPLIAWGCGAPYFAEATAITDVTPALTEAVKHMRPKGASDQIA